MRHLDPPDEDYGFTWGPIRVTRIGSVKRGKGFVRVLGINTGHHEIELCVSTTGRGVRVFIDGEEMRR